MKAIRILMTAALLLTAVSTAHADEDKAISADKLPKKSQEFISRYFSGNDVSYAKVERELFDRSYEVFFVNGSKVEFDKNGEWDNVDCFRSPVPAGIVPARIEEYVRRNHSGQAIVKVERDRRDYEIELGNGVEIRFDLAFNVIGYDD